MRMGFATLLSAAFCAAPLSSQTNQPAAPPEATLHVTSRAVLVDVLVTDRNGTPVKGLQQSAFTLNEQGKPQTISFFEEHAGAPGPLKEIPRLPPNVFSNFSPYPDPPAVNVLLLDSLNTPLDDQQFVHTQALKFLMSAKPGTRMAIFALGQGLHFIQGFTDDPTLLAAALNNRSNSELEPSAVIQSPTENTALAMVTSAGASAGMNSGFSTLGTENGASRITGRELQSMALLQKLATFLSGFPGRKNVIWFSEVFPLFRRNNDGTPPNVDLGVTTTFDKTMAMLATARIALYPVDARGTDTSSLYQFPSPISSPSQVMGNQGAEVSIPLQEGIDRAAARYAEEVMAQETGGKAFMQTNGLAEVIDNIASSSSDFYTLSYVPANQKMDGSYRKIEVKVAGGHYNLSYRRGYPAIEDALPGSVATSRAVATEKPAAPNPAAVDPLLPFMDLGLPQTQQILFKVLVKPLQENRDSNTGQIAPTQAATPAAPTAPQGPQTNHKVNFSIDLSDLTLGQDADGQHTGALSVSVLAYDRYGNIVSRRDTQATIGIKPEAWEIYQKTGLLFGTEIPVPKGHFWLRIGVYDQGSGKVGTLEIPLDSVTTIAQKAP
jgi:VWFA-related protein